MALNTGLVRGAGAHHQRRKAKGKMQAGMKLLRAPQGPHRVAGQEAQQVVVSKVPRSLCPESIQVSQAASLGARLGQEGAGCGPIPGTGSELRDWRSSRRREAREPSTVRAQRPGRDEWSWGSLQSSGTQRAECPDWGVQRQMKGLSREDITGRWQREVLGRPPHQEPLLLGALR